MRRASEVADNTLALCGMSIRLELKRHYGSPEAAEEAIRGVAEDTEALEHWASVVTARRHQIEIARGAPPVSADENGAPFRFSDLPAPMREAAKLSMAAAMLAYTSRLEKARPA
jgi:hypothetical protein